MTRPNSCTKRSQRHAFSIEEGDFIQDIQFEYASLQNHLADLDEKQLTRPGVGGHGRWSIKDMLAHLHEWHTMALRWYEVGLTGKRDAIPAAKDCPSLKKIGGEPLFFPNAKR